MQVTNFRKGFLPAIIALSILCVPIIGSAHPLGNFTVNHFARIEPGASRINIHYVVDMAEIPTLQEMAAIDADGDGSASDEELNAYLGRVWPGYIEGIHINLDGRVLPVEVISKRIALPVGAGGLATLRIEIDLSTPVSIDGVGRLRFEDRNHAERLGWREIVVTPIEGVTAFDSTAFASGLSDELKSYPEDMLAAPLDERKAEFSFTAGGLPEGAKALVTRDGQTAAATRDRFAELIAVKELTLSVALIGLLIAMVLGATHALSPGHGKAVVGAYLIGARGTARHAAYLGLTVTITHTVGVFALGIVTLFASNYILPEKLFPVLSLVSGVIVVLVGLNLFTRRLRAAIIKSHDHHHHSHDHHAHDHDHHHDHAHGHHHDHSHSSHSHSHGGKEHSHLPPGADNAPITWRSIVALGISGGLLPCPSALVVLLSAISLNRVGYGLLLVVAFSLGLAATLTAVGLLFVYAGHLFRQPKAGWVMRVAPVASALVITLVGLAICYEAAIQAGIKIKIMSPFAIFL
jgi:ABC-type nickel/cobalt efflux system permease component RcnA